MPEPYKALVPEERWVLYQPPHSTPLVVTDGPALSTGHSVTVVAEEPTLSEELCRCVECGHAQAEPNWCHKCGHRTSQPPWAKRLLDELTAAKEGTEKLEEAREALGKLIDHDLTGERLWLTGTQAETAGAIESLLEATLPTLQSSGEGEPIPRDYWREVPCGHPPDPLAMFGRGGEPVCHCGCILDQQDGVHVELAPGPIVHCQNCGCGVAIPGTTDKEGGDEK